VEGHQKKIVFAAGGTGGHLYPALAVARELKRRRPGASIVFVGGHRGLEHDLVPCAGFPLIELSLSGLKGVGGTRRVRAVAEAAWAVLRLTWWMARRRPDLVIGAGGFASGPAVLAALVLNVRTMVIEQNHLPGATNRWLGPRVDAVCLPADSARARIGGRLFVTGNPVREEFAAIGDPPRRPELSLLVFGGSRGARSINRAMCAALPELSRLDPPPRIVHQTGAADETEVRSAYQLYPDDRYQVHAFLDDMPQRLADADVVVCRAGASTIAELCVAGRPALLIPYPHAADDHQRINAQALGAVGAALVVEDRDLDGPRLAQALAALAGDPERRRAMGQAARLLGRPNATAGIADIAERLLTGGLEEVPRVS
jgi:UDP-N-acetylglucosamine--N-acetylmuramyl-(pentapeptide) pyrophosphoryl-undecaprenol N-acetylglucosamine transferase